MQALLLLIPFEIMMKSILCFVLVVIAVCEGGRGEHRGHGGHMSGDQDHSSHHAMCTFNSNGVTGAIHLQHLGGSTGTMRVVLNGGAPSSTGYHVMKHVNGDCTNPGPEFGSHSMMSMLPASDTGTFDETVTVNVPSSARRRGRIIGRSIVIHTGMGHGMDTHIACCVVGIGQM